MHCMDMLMCVGGVARWVSVCHYTYSVLGFSGTQSFHINVRKLVRFQHRDEKIPGRLCRESSLALSCVCVRVWPRAISRPPLRRCGCADPDLPRGARSLPGRRGCRLSLFGLFSYEKHICVAANGGS